MAVPPGSNRVEGRLGPCVVVMLALAAAVPAGAQTVTPIGTTPHAVRGVGSEVTLWVPLQLSSIVPDSVHLVDISEDGYRESELRDAVSVALGTDGGVTGLSVEMDLTALDAWGRPDTLDLELLFWDDTITAPMSLAVRRPNAVLEDPGTIRVDRVRGQGGDGGFSLSIRETSGLSRVTGLRVRSKPFTDEDSRATDLRVELVGGAGTIEAGGDTTLSLRLLGDAPPGQTDGSVELDAPQLAEPVEVDVEVVTRGPLPWLLGCIVLGLFLGFATRVWLVRIRQVGEARQKAKEMFDALAAARRDAKDGDFLSEVRRAEDDLRTELSLELSAEKVTAAVTAAQQKLEGALSALKEDLETEAGRVNTMRDLTSAPWEVPDWLGEALQHAESTITQAARALADSDAVSARAILDGVLPTMVGQLRDPLPDWRSTVTDALDALPALSHGLPAVVVRRLTASTTGLKNELAGITLPASGSQTQQSLTQTIGGVELARRKLYVLLLDLLRWTDRVLDQIETDFGSQADPKTFKELRDRVKALPKPTMGRLETTLDPVLERDLRELWRAAIVASAVGGADLTAVNASVDKNEYVEATALARSKPSQRVAPTNVVWDDGSAVRWAAPPSSSRPAGAAPTGTAVLVRPTVMPFRVYSRGEIMLARVTRWLIVATIIATAGVLLLRDDFQGAWDDLLKAVLWGFSLDVTTEVAIEQAKASQA